MGREDNYTWIHSSDIINITKELVKQSATIKKELFKSLLMEKDIDYSEIKRYISFINDTLSSWEHKAELLADEMHNARGREGVYTIGYNEIKDYIYANNDYASILQFVDGIIKGMESNKIKEVEDIEDFFDHTISKAFDDQADSVAGLLDNVVNMFQTTNNGKTDTLGAKMFDSVKTYKQMFNSRDRVELYKAISETVKFVTSGDILRKYRNSYDTKIFVSLVNMIVEYISYSVTIYTTRIYAIAQYAQPFFRGNEISESVKLPNNGIDFDSIEIRIMRDADDSVCREMEYYNDLMKVLYNFATTIGCTKYISDNTITLDDILRIPYNFNNNKFSDKLLSNPLMNIMNRFEVYVNPVRTINELHMVLKSCVYNQQQGLDNTSSPKQEILAIIRGTNLGDTAVKYQELAAELIKFTSSICGKLRYISRDILEYNNRNSDNIPFIKIASISNECVKMISDIYKEITMAIIEKARDIETHYNKLHKSDVNKTVAGMNIKIPGIDKDQKLTTTNISNSVPDTARIPVDLTDMYTLPSFESMQLYDEYVRSLPGFENDIYLSEAVGLSQIVNAIKSLFNGIWYKWNNFIADKRFQAAVEYVINREAELNALTFSGAEMQVLPFKFDKNETNPPKEIWENLINGMNNFGNKINEKTTADDIKKFVTDLYPSPVVYSWFSGEGADPKKAAIKYRNYILFDEEANARDTEIPREKITDNEIYKRLRVWINTVKESRKLHADLKAVKDRMDQAHNKLKADVTNITSMEKQQQRQTSSTSTAGATSSSSTSTPQSVSGTSSTSGGSISGVSSVQNIQEDVVIGGDRSVVESQQQTNQANTNQQGLSEMLGSLNIGIYTNVLTDVQTAINRLWAPMINLFIEYITTEYKYIQEAYSKGKRAQ